MRFSRKFDRILAMMPPGVANYQGKSGKSSTFYAVAEALNSGAVRQARAVRAVRDPVSDAITGFKKKGLLGAAAARTLKLNALGLPTSKRALSSLRGGLNTKTIKRKGTKFGLGNKVERERSVVFAGGTGKGGAVVIRPRPFFFFDSGQQEQLLAAFFEKFNALLMREARA